MDHSINIIAVATRMTITRSILGIDIAKRSFAVCLLHEGKQIDKQFPNSPQGFTKLGRFLGANGVTVLHACMESTGTYGMALARWVHQHGHTVSIVNAARISSYAASLMRRTKTDKADAQVIALFCLHQQPAAWTPPAAEIEQLQGLVRHLDALVRDRQQQVNRLGDESLSETVKQSLAAIIAVFDEQIKLLKKRLHDHMNQHPELRRQRDLLQTIPGIAELTAAKLLAEVLEFSRYDSAQKLVAYAGLSPATRQSGSSLRTRGHISKNGSSRLRTALYMPALVALKHNPLVQQLQARLQSRGKAPKQIIVAAMRKLLTLAYGVIKSGQPFNPNFSA
jgi:transposase